MRAKHLSLLVLMSLFLVNVSAFSFTKTISNSEQKIKISIEKLNVRLDPSLDSSVIKIIVKGTILEPLQKKGEWYHIEFFDEESGFNLTGYIHQSGVIPIKDDSEIEKTKKEKVASDQILEPSRIISR